LVLSPSFEYVADIDSTRPPTTAIQVESEAIIPMTRAVPRDTLLVLIKFTKPAFCKITNAMAKMITIGMANLKSDKFFFVVVLSADR